MNTERGGKQFIVRPDNIPILFECNIETQG
jgi:hypothetical protein